jgi:hypothetical protein
MKLVNNVRTFGTVVGAAALVLAGGAESGAAVRAHKEPAMQISKNGARPPPAWAMCRAGAGPYA